MSQGERILGVGANLSIEIGKGIRQKNRFVLGKPIQRAAMTHLQPAVLFFEHGVGQVGQLGDIDMPSEKPQSRKFGGGMADPDARFPGHDFSPDPRIVAVA